MDIGNTLWRVRRPAAVVLTAAAIVGSGSLVGLALPQYTVSQKGANFIPAR